MDHPDDKGLFSGFSWGHFISDWPNSKKRKEIAGKTGDTSKKHSTIHVADMTTLPALATLRPKFSALSSLKSSSRPALLLKTAPWTITLESPLTDQNAVH